MKAFKLLLLFILFIGVLGWLLPQRFSNPLVGAAKYSYNAQSFWYSPWGKSVTHKEVVFLQKKALR
ncbi:hypothetical protein [Anditalea andensis]|uniref:hypothetical protein n=1 Tax=Anditalea andensis TaxID=1048983 RepID=UPI000556C23E|nr:hypothetical protein [Anditalea andensis]